MWVPTVLVYGCFIFSPVTVSLTVTEPGDRNAPSTRRAEELRQLADALRAPEGILVLSISAGSHSVADGRLEQTDQKTVRTDALELRRRTVTKRC